MSQLFGKQNSIVLQRIVKNICDGVCKYKTRIQIQSGTTLGYSYIEDTKRGQVANICINPDNEIFNGLNTNTKYVGALGVAIHEILHIVFTNFRLFYQKMDEVMSIKSEMFKTMFNIFEDSRIENFVGEIFGGLGKKSLLFVIDYIWQKSPDINPMAHPLDQIISALIQYGDIGKIKGDFSDEETRKNFLYLANMLDEAASQHKCSECIRLAEEATNFLADNYLSVVMSHISSFADDTIKNSEGQDAKGNGNAKTQQQRQKTKDEQQKKADNAKKAGSQSQDGNDVQQNTQQSSQNEQSEQQNTQQSSQNGQGEQQNTQQSSQNGQGEQQNTQQSGQDEQDGQGEQQSGQDEQGEQQNSQQNGQGEDNAKRIQKNEGLDDGSDNHTEDTSKKTDDGDPSDTDTTDTNGDTNDTKASENSEEDDDDDFDFSEIENSIKEAIKEATTQLRNELKDGESKRFELEDPEANFGNFIKIPVNEEDYDEYDRFADRYLVYERGMELASSLTPIFKSKRKGWKQNKTGKVNIKRYTDPNFNSPYIFDKRLDKVNDASVMILVDCSGSMYSQGKMSEAKAMAMEMATAFNKLNIPFCIAGHSGSDDGHGELNFRLYKDYDQRNFENVVKMCDMNYNFDGAAIRTATSLVRSRKEKSRILFVITDGMSHNRENCRRAVEEAKKYCTVVGISLLVSQEEVDSFTAMYGANNFIACKEMSQLNPLITAKLRQMSVNW